MAIGPGQLIVLGVSHPDFHGEIIADLGRLRESDTVRVIDALAVYKDAKGEIEIEHPSNLTQERVRVEQTGDLLGRRGLGWGGGVGVVSGLFAPRLLAPIAVGAAAGGLTGKFAGTVKENDQPP